MVGVVDWKDGITEYHMAVVQVIFQSTLNWDLDSGVKARREEEYTVEVKHAPETLRKSTMWKVAEGT